MLIAFSLCVYAYPIEEKDISVEDSSHAESESDSKITKRSGSFDIFSQIKSVRFFSFIFCLFYCKFKYSKNAPFFTKQLKRVEVCLFVLISKKFINSAVCYEIGS